MKITALVENVSLTDEIQSEHGLSLYIETEEKKIALTFDAAWADMRWMEL